jgi:hypothetical protein
MPAERTLNSGGKQTTAPTAEDVHNLGLKFLLAPPDTCLIPA